MTRRHAFAALLVLVLVAANRPDQPAVTSQAAAVVCVNSKQRLTQAYATDSSDQKVTATWNDCRTAAPWVITVHGGGWLDGNPSSMTTAVDSFYAAGWQVFNIEYRRTAASSAWADQAEDVNTVVDWVRARAGQYRLNPERGTVFGFSAGGHIATFASHAPGVSSVVSVAGVLRPQFVTEPGLRQREVDFVGCDPDDAAVPRTACASAWSAFEPEARVTPGQASLFAAQGGADVVVPPDSVDEYAALLRAKGVPVTVSKVAGLGHTQDLVFDGGPREAAMQAWVRAQW